MVTPLVTALAGHSGIYSRNGKEFVEKAGVEGWIKQFLCVA